MGVYLLHQSTSYISLPPVSVYLLHHSTSHINLPPTSVYLLHKSTSYISRVFRVKLTSFLIFYVTFIPVSSCFWVYFLFIPFSSTNLISQFHAINFLTNIITIFFIFYFNFFSFLFPIIFISSPYIIYYHYLLLFKKSILIFFQVKFSYRNEIQSKQSHVSKEVNTNCASCVTDRPVINSNRESRRTLGIVYRKTCIGLCISVWRKTICTQRNTHWFAFCF